MRLILGKFIGKDGKEVPPMFGDREQIDALNHANEVKEQLENGTYEAYISEDADEGDWPCFFFQVECFCGRFPVKYFYHNRGPIKPKTLICECNRKYSARNNPDSEFTLLVKYGGMMGE